MDCEIYHSSILIIIINFQLFSQNKTRTRVKSRLKGLTHTHEKTCILLTDKENIENEEKVNL